MLDKFYTKLGVWASGPEPNVVGNKLRMDYYYKYHDFIESKRLLGFKVKYIDDSLGQEDFDDDANGLTDGLAEEVSNILPKDSYKPKHAREDLSIDELLDAIDNYTPKH